MEKKYINKLAEQSSPYLLQHAHNPVEWYPWSKEALEKAQLENKLLLISIGYAACHWCHVMEKESFEDEGIAKIMNEHFICIKVDREERPDIDQIYMEAVQLMTGRGGWPLNCFALPDGRPVYGGTYFPKNQWKHVLENLPQTYKTEPEKFFNAANNISSHIIQLGLVTEKNGSQTYTFEDLRDIITPWKRTFDNIYGGSNHAPKFPMPNSYEFLLNYSYYSSDSETLEHVFKTLDQMALGGIYDHVGGGFARYSVDKKWLVPHFEKMLYDNSQLVSLYSKAYQYSKKSLYKKTVYQTLDFIERELYSNEGAFFSSLDADSEGEEGKYYIWKKEELTELLGKEADVYCEFYQVNFHGNWEHNKNILHRGDKEKSIATKNKLSHEELIDKIETLNKKVLAHREKRVKPGLDDKILASWNGLMLKAYVDAYRTFGENRFLETATKNANFILQNMIESDYRIWRNYKDGKVSINGFLDDYAFIIEAFIHLYQATFDENWIQTAKKIMDYTMEHFHDKQSGMFYYTSDLDPQLIARKMEINDNVIPASNSAMAKNLFYLGHFYYSDEYINLSKQMLDNISEDIKTSGAYYSNWGLLMLHQVYGLREVAISGSKAEEFRKELDVTYLPEIIIAGSKTKNDLPILANRFAEGEIKIYVCQNKVCKMPVNNVKEALEQIK